MVWGEVAAVDFGVGVAFLHFTLFFWWRKWRKKWRNSVKLSVVYGTNNYYVKSGQPETRTVIKLHFHGFVILFPLISLVAIDFLTFWLWYIFSKIYLLQLFFTLLHLKRKLWLRLVFSRRDWLYKMIIWLLSCSFFLYISPFQLIFWDRIF